MIVCVGEVQVHVVKLGTNTKVCQWKKNIEILWLQGTVCHHRKLLYIEKDMYVVTVLAALVLFQFVSRLYLECLWTLSTTYQFVIFSLTLQLVLCCYANTLYRMGIIFSPSPSSLFFSP